MTYQPSSETLSWGITEFVILSTEYTGLDPGPARFAQVSTMVSSHVCVAELAALPKSMCIADNSGSAWSKKI